MSSCRKRTLAQPPAWRARLCEGLCRSLYPRRHDGQSPRRASPRRMSQSHQICSRLRRAWVYEQGIHGVWTDSDKHRSPRSEVVCHSVNCHMCESECTLPLARSALPLNVRCALERRRPEVREPAMREPTYTIIRTRRTKHLTPQLLDPCTL